MKKTTLFTLLVFLLFMPLTLYLGSRLEGNGYYLICTLLIVEAMLPFFLSFEHRKVQARELVIIAVMAALAAVSRAVFAFLPHFKPITAIIMICGVAYGAQAGFLSGALAALASNFAFGQGFWTPWQMFAYGMGGCLAGLLFHRRRISEGSFFYAALTVFGFCTIMLVVGPLLDCSSLFLFGSELSLSRIITVFTVSLPINLMHAVSCAVSLLLFGKALLAKLIRLQTKYGLIQ